MTLQRRERPSSAPISRQQSWTGAGDAQGGKAGPPGQAGAAGAGNSQPPAAGRSQGRYQGIMMSRDMDADMAARLAQRLGMSDAPRLHSKDAPQADRTDLGMRRMTTNKQKWVAAHPESKIILSSRPASASAAAAARRNARAISVPGVNAPWGAEPRGGGDSILDGMSEGSEIMPDEEVHRMGSCQLRELDELLHKTRKPIIVDLGGRALSGKTTVETSSAMHISHSVTLRNGSLKLPPTLVVVVGKGGRLRLENVEIRGTGMTGQDYFSGVHGVLEVDGGEVVMINSTVSGGNATKCATLAVKNGGKADLSHCEVGHNVRCAAALVTGQGSSLEARDCDFCDCWGYPCVLVQQSAIARFRGSAITGSRSGPAGISISGASHVALKGCQVYDHDNAGVLVTASTGHLYGCDVCGVASPQRSAAGVRVEQSGTVRLFGSEVHDIAGHGIQVSSGSSVMMDETVIRQNQRCGVVAGDRGALDEEATVIATKSSVMSNKKYGVLVQADRGLIDLAGCKVMSNGGGSGLTLGTEHPSTYITMDGATQLDQPLKRWVGGALVL